MSFHGSDVAGTKAGWTSARHAALLGEDWGDVELIDNSDYNYDFCDTFDFVHRGRVLLSLDISHVAEVFRVTGWAERKQRQRTSTAALVVADTVAAQVREMLGRVGFREVPVEDQSLHVPGVLLELSEPDEVTLGKCLFKDYDGPAAKGAAHSGVIPTTSTQS